MYDYMENLKKQRFLKIDRQRAGITAHRILKIYENKVDIAVKPILSKTGSITVPMNDTSGLQVGDYLDFQFSYTNQLPRCKHSSTVLGSYVAAHSTCLSLLLPQARKRGMRICLSLLLHIIE